MLAQKIEGNFYSDYAAIMEQSNVHNGIGKVGFYPYIKKDHGYFFMALTGLFLCLPALIFFYHSYQVRNSRSSFFTYKRELDLMANILK